MKVFFFAYFSFLSIFLNLKLRLSSSSISYSSISNEADLLYPTDGLLNLGSLYPLGGEIPSSRVMNSIVSTGNYIIIYGGYNTEGLLLNDVNLYDTRLQQWSNPILRKYCCDDFGDVFDILGFDSDFLLPLGTKPYKSDFPVARAEHVGVSVSEKMYIFGGVTKNYGYANDLYSFDPFKLAWRKISNNEGDMPRRRASASAVSGMTDHTFYMFGGRSTFGSDLDTPRGIIGLNDLWSYNTRRNRWDEMSIPNDNRPSGRQHAAISMFEEKIFIFGGIDPSSNITFNDVWVFSLALKTWDKLSSSMISSKGEFYDGLSPPPLFKSLMIPIALTTASSPKSNTSIDAVSVGLSGFLIYGGVGGGGACGSITCNPLQVSLGQVYFFSMRENKWRTMHIRDGAGQEGHGHASSYFDDSSWEFARLTSSDSYSYKGRLLKRYAYESAVYLPLSQQLFEVGGLQSVPMSLTQDNQATAAAAYGDDKDAGVTDPAPASLDAGGHVYPSLWDLATGEQLRTRLGIPTNGPWLFSDAYTRSQPQQNFTKIMFHRASRTFKVYNENIILIETHHPK